MDFGFLFKDILADNYSIPYLLTLFAYIIHEMLGLRLILLGAHAGYFYLAITGNHPAGIFWNGIFIIINGYHVIKIILSRRVIHFEPEVEDLYTSVFSSLSRNDFKTFWNLGKEEILENEIVLAEGDAPTALGLIKSGHVLVEKSGALLNRLGPGRFFAEMGFLTRQKASATIRTVEISVFHFWDYEVLDPFFHKFPDIFHGLQGILGREMAQKIAEQNPR